MEDVYKNQNMARGKKWWALREKKKTSKATTRKRIHTHARAQVTGKSSHRQIMKKTLSDKYTHKEIFPYMQEEKKRRNNEQKKTQPISVNI